MAINLERFKKDLTDLKSRGTMLLCAMVREAEGEKSLRKSLAHCTDEQFLEIAKKIPAFKQGYEKWYTESLVVVKQIIPDRLEAFIQQYEKPKNRKDISWNNYVIQDFMIGLRVTRGGETVVGISAAIPKFQIQTAILDAAEARFTSSLFEIRQLLQADIFDTEIDTARELLKHKFLRAAGAIAGVVLEKHLTQVCGDHAVKVVKKHPGINDLNDLLKNNGIIDIPQWRNISWLGDIRNICDHNKEKEPTEIQIIDLIDGTDKILKTIA